jgi:hypothetical protein
MLPSSTCGSSAGSGRRGRAGLEERVEVGLADTHPALSDPDCAELAAVYPVPNGLLVDLQGRGNLVHRQKFVHDD